MSRSNALVILGVALVFGTGLQAAETPPVIFASPLSPRNANYEISVELDPVQHSLKGKEIIHWRNLTQDTVSDLEFHLYLNAFANNESVFMKESGGRHRSFSFDDKGWGYCRVTALTQVDGASQTPLQLSYPGPDRTVMRAKLAQAVSPGGEIELSVTFEDKLPKVFARAGYAGQFHMAGQWFPKLGVYEQGKGWNCHTYHLNSEFYSDFGVYDVAVTLPENFILGATGVAWRETKSGGKKTISLHAEDVHDFAFCAAPHFLVQEETWEGVKIRILMQPGNKASLPRYSAAVRKALEYNAKWLWKYPYPQVTVVDPPRTGEGAGGMEYPMLFTGMASPFIGESFRLPEMVVVHEFGHEYWYGMSASNEFEEAWLDEGINSYYEVRIMDAWLGADRSIMDGFLGFRMGDVAQQRIQYLSVPDMDPVVQPSWEYGGFGTYAAMSYSKPAMALKVLEGVLGTEEMDRVMRAFFEQVRFTHPTTQDFLRITSEAAGRDLRPILEPMLFGTGTVDFKVAEVRNTPKEDAKGYDFSADPPKLIEKPKEKKGEKPDAAGAKKGGGDGAKPKAKEKGDKKKKYDSTVTVQRKGDLQLPVEVEVSFSDGTKKMEKWDGSGRHYKWTYVGPKVTQVIVDPAGKVPIDLDRLNNGWVSKQSGTAAASLAGRMRTGFQLFFSLLGELF